MSSLSAETRIAADRSPVTFYLPELMDKPKAARAVVRAACVFTHLKPVDFECSEGIDTLPRTLELPSVTVPAAHFPPPTLALLARVLVCVSRCRRRRRRRQYSVRGTGQARAG